MKNILYTWACVFYKNGNICEVFGHPVDRKRYEFHSLTDAYKSLMDDLQEIHWDWTASGDTLKYGNDLTKDEKIDMSSETMKNTKPFQLTKNDCHGLEPVSYDEVLGIATLETGDESDNSHFKCVWQLLKFTDSADEVNDDEVENEADPPEYIPWEERIRRMTLKEAAITYINEVGKFQITCDTQASDRLHRFCGKLKENGLNKFADKIEKLDERGAGRKRSATYALVVAGLVLGMEDVSKFEFDK